MTAVRQVVSTDEPSRRPAECNIADADIKKQGFLFPDVDVTISRLAAGTTPT
jgi:hypothetical protein